MKRNLSLLLAVLMFVSVFAVGAFAAEEDASSETETAAEETHEYTAVKSGKAVTIGSEIGYYKLTLAKDSAVKISWIGNTDGIVDVHFHAEPNSDLTFTFFQSGNSKGTEYHAMAKGTYYISASARAGTKITFTVIPAVNKANYCRAKAISLKKNAKVTIIQTPDYNYARWYKITLTKKQRLNIYTNEDAYQVRLFNAKGNPVTLDRDSKRAYTSYKLNKGTYYIRVGCLSSFGNDYGGLYTTLYWK